MKRNYTAFFLLLSLLFPGLAAGQKPYCSASHNSQNSSIGNNNRNNYVIALETIRLKEGNQIIFNLPGDGFSGKTNCGEEYRLANDVNDPVLLYKGGTYIIEASSSTAFSYHANFGAFIDLNNDKDFNDPGEFLGSWADRHNGKYNQTGLTPLEIPIPCNIPTGLNRLRIVCNYSGEPVTKNYGCQTCNGILSYGETVDITLNIQNPPSFTANISTPNDTLWPKRTNLFFTDNKLSCYTHFWDVDNDGTIEQSSKIPSFTNNRNVWTAPGNACIKLKTATCNAIDSTVLCIPVSIPPSPPKIDFIAHTTFISQYDVLSLFDLSKYGPYKWKWEVYDSTTYAAQGFYPSIMSGDVISDPFEIGQDEFSENPQMMFTYPGCYTVSLVAENDAGVSKTFSKTCYITVHLPTQFFLGYGVYGPAYNNVVESSTGTIVDDGGKDESYTNNQGLATRSFLCISPCSAKKIHLELEQLKFSDIRDRLMIWDGNSPGTGSSVLLGEFSLGSKTPVTITALSGSMYILFESDSFGIDSGYYGRYYSEIGKPSETRPQFTIDSNSLYKNVPVSFVNTTELVTGVPAWNWKVDQISILNSDGRKLNHVFSDTGFHSVCLEMISCSGMRTECSRVHIKEAPLKQVEIDFSVSEIRPHTGIGKVYLKTENNFANRFEWQISPSSYILLNPPSAPSIVSPGYIGYQSLPGDSIPVPELRFTAPGCYTITLTAYYDQTPFLSARTIIKQNILCAIDYCKPPVYILSEDIGLSELSIKTSNESKIHKSEPGKSSYTDFSGEFAFPLHFCENFEVNFKRKTATNPVNAWIYFDWNADSDFEDAGEKYKLASGSLASQFSISLKVPDKSIVYDYNSPRLIRMRIQMNYNHDSTRICGPNTAGETKDYLLLVSEDLQKPIVSLIGADTIYLNNKQTYIEQGAIAIDNIEGDISSGIISSGNFKPNTPGTYYIDYTSCDCSENCETERRTIIVEKYLEPITILINNNQNSCIEAARNNADYVDPGAIAYQLSPPVNHNNLIQVEGKVNTRRVGDYTLKYSVYTGNQSAYAIRKVCVRDRTPPILYAPQERDTNVQIGNLWADPVYAEDAYNWNCVIQREWGNNKALNTLVKGIYYVKYTAIDSSGNVSEPLVVYYRVDDFIPPQIQLNTPDVIEHDVGSPYFPVDVSATDNFYKEHEIAILMISTNVEPYKLGTYQEVYEAIDGSGNRTLKTRTVKIVDKTAPRIWAETIHGCVGEEIWPMWGIQISDNYYSPELLKDYVEIVFQDVNIWEEGIYQIVYKVTDPSGNVSDLMVRYVEFRYFPNCRNSTVSIDEMAKIENPIVYPNPGTGIYNLKLPHNIESAKIKLYNTTGSLMYKSDVSQNEEKLNFEDLTAGVYMLECIFNGQIYRLKIIHKP